MAQRTRDRHTSVVGSHHAARRCICAASFVPRDGQAGNILYQREQTTVTTLEVQFGSAPVSSLGVPPTDHQSHRLQRARSKAPLLDGVVGFEAHPLRQGSVLLHLLAELSLDLE